MLTPEEDARISKLERDLANTISLIEKQIPTVLTGLAARAEDARIANIENGLSSLRSMLEKEIPTILKGLAAAADEHIKNRERTNKLSRFVVNKLIPDEQLRAQILDDLTSKERGEEQVQSLLEDIKKTLPPAASPPVA